jgi:hypothetical protein
MEESSQKYEIMKMSIFKEISRVGIWTEMLVGNNVLQASMQNVERMLT